VLLACLVCQMGLGCSYVFSPILKHIVADLEWSRAGFAVGSGWLLVSMSLAFPLIGSLAQRFGPRAVLSGCTLLLGGAFLLMSAIQSPWQFYLVNVVLGVALAGLGDIVVGAVASRWVEGRRGLALGLIYSGSNFGGALVGVTAGLVLQAESWRLAVAGVGAGAVALVLPFAAFGVREPPLESRSPPSEIAGEAADLDLAAALRTRSFWLLAFVLFAFYFYYVGVLNHLVAFLTDIGLSDRDASLGFAFSILMGVAAKLGIGGLADRISRKAATLLNFAVLTGASFLLLAIRLPAALPVFLAAQGFATAAENVLLPLMVGECFGTRHLERIYGALMLTLLAGALGQIFAGAVFDRLGSYDVAFTTFAILNVLALGALAALRNERGRGELSWT
jgi:MFS family permease